ncbi:OmpA family protein [Niallia sp. Krafla_26]|uniref:OmpA family protein n=1 Tax=Niallia sp. Krafla_26 TaxID=3064703 RepID=UPI003D172F83
MKGKTLSMMAFILCLFLLVGCNQETNNNAEESSQVEESEKKTEGEKKDETQVKDTEQTNSSEEEQKKIAKSSSEEKSNGVTLGDYNVFLGGEMIETEGKITIKGESNLLPGSRVVGEVLVDDEKFFADTTEIVQEDGSFTMEIDHHDLDETTKVALKFHFDGQQDDSIKRNYGERGQKLTGNYIYTHKGKVGGGDPQNIYKMAKTEVTFDQGEEMAVRQFSEPSWYQIPEDMGEPRVWIEIEEIKNDENYYYLHGRSNLLEGSILHGSFVFDNDQASVLPDGSFNMKFKYEYKENAEFELKFDPSLYYQWNVIKETYGEKGQKLVGDLVVQNRYSDNLYIEKVEKLNSTEIKVPDNVEVKIEGTEVTMLVPDHLMFDFDQYQLKEESKTMLQDIAQTIQSYEKDIHIEINGHTDNVGDKQYNLELSQKRADEVKNFLTTQGDFSKVQITTKGYGMTKPIASNDDETGQAKNRRVEIVIDLKK